MPTPSPRPTIFVIDDDEAVRDSLCVLLEAEGYLSLAFCTAEAFLSSQADSGHGCAIIDIRMPGMSGLELQRELNVRAPGLPVILLTSYGDVPKAVAALKAGAVDFIEKPFDVDDLLRAVREALDRQQTSLESAAAATEFQARLSLLTNREREVMEMIAAGHPNKVVASRLAISIRTAEVHRARVMEKMGCRNLPALIHLIMRNQMPAGS